MPSSLNHLLRKAEGNARWSFTNPYKSFTFFVLCFWF